MLEFMSIRAYRLDARLTFHVTIWRASNFSMLIT